MKTLPPASRPFRCLVNGDTVPAFELVDPISGILRSSDLLRAGPMLLTFYRGAWCGCCQADLHDVTQAMPLLKSRKLTVLGVFHDLSSADNARIRETYKLGFPIVDDPAGRAAEAFGLRRSPDEMAKIEDAFGPELLALKEGQPWIKPMQARYMIGADGVIAHSELVTNYNDRSSVASLLPLLDALAG